MIIKLIIIGVILIGGGIIFANEVNQFLPVNSANLVDSFGSYVYTKKDNTVKATETKVEGTFVTINKEINNFKDSSSEILSKNINDVTESTKKGLKEISDSTQQNIKKVSESAQKTIFGDGKNNQKQNNLQNKEHNNDSTNTNDETIVTFTTENTQPQPNENTIASETLSLTTIQQESDDVMLRYKDTSEKTISVSVTLRTTDRELFSGMFYSSMFETLVNNATNTPYFIDMIVEHKEYGTISSSVYNPGNSPNTIINGVFSKK